MSLVERARAEVMSEGEHALLDLLERVLFKLYESEFEIVDGYNRHPDLINFEEWLEREYPAV